ncbi:DUF6366 family protein [Alkalihalobacillus sp. FSL R5-0424]
MAHQQKETPEEKRERLRFEEQKRNAGANFSDGVDRSYGGGLGDLGWKGVLGLLVLLIGGYIGYRLYVLGYFPW